MFWHVALFFIPGGIESTRQKLLFRYQILVLVTWFFNQKIVLNTLYLWSNHVELYISYIQMELRVREKAQKRQKWPSDPKYICLHCKILKEIRILYLAWDLKYIHREEYNKKKWFWLLKQERKSSPMSWKDFG